MRLKKIFSRSRLTDRRLAAAHNINDLRRIAKRRLPRVIFDFVDGAAYMAIAGEMNDVGSI